jgi:hypothetical protein
MHPGDGQGPTAPDRVRRLAQDLVIEAHALVGDRFAEARGDLDSGLLSVTIIDLTDRDIAAITDVARRLGIADWVRVERTDPADLEAWERLRHDLQRLWDAEPRLMVQSPTPDPGYRRPPVQIHLTAIAESAAAELHDSYGDFVSLRVGALSYPPVASPPSPPRGSARTIDRDTVNPAEMRIVLESPLVLGSGQTTTHGLLLTNLGEHDISVHTNGQLTATIVDEAGAAVGGYAGIQTLPLVVFTAAPAETVRIPVLVGTASFSPELGYAVPAGSWHLTALMKLADGRHLLTPALPLTIT